MRSTLSQKVFHTTRRKNGSAVSRLKWAKSFHGLPRMPLVTLKSLKAISAP